MHTTRPSPLASFLFAASTEFLNSKEFAALPRAMRQAIRAATLINPTPAHHVAQSDPSRTNSRTHLDCDLNMQSTPVIDDSAYYCTNTVDPDMDIDGSAEFNDSDESDNLLGLTIVQPEHGSVRRWLKGYDII